MVQRSNKGEARGRVNPSVGNLGIHNRIPNVLNVVVDVDEVHRDELVVYIRVVELVLQPFVPEHLFSVAVPVHSRV